MSLAPYQIAVIDPLTGTQLDILDSRRFYSLEYNRKLNDYGRFTMTVLASDRLRTLSGTIPSIMDTAYNANIIFEIYRSEDNGLTFQVEDTYLLRYVSQFQDEQDVDWLVLGGESILSFFANTLIIPEDDPNGANGYSTKSGIADLVMYGYVTDQIISPFTNADRARAYISNAPSVNQGQPIFARKSYDNLLETLKSFVVQGAIDFTLKRTTGANFLFTVEIVGRDLTYTTNQGGGASLIFKPERKNLKHPSLTVDRYNEVTVTWVATQGIEEERLVTSVPSPHLYNALNRRENTIDAREIENDASLLDGITTAGFAELRDKQPQITFDFEIDTTMAGARYQTDWQLGDRITAQYMDYSQDLRIVEAMIQIEGSSEVITPVFEKLIL